MNTITYTQRYLPHELNTKFHAVKLYRSGVGVDFVIRRYHISKSSLMRWNKKFDGTKESLLDKSHRPHSSHPNAHTPEELKWIRDYLRRNPHISICELYGKLKRDKGYSRHPGSLYRVCRRLGYSSQAPSAKKAYKPKKYDTPTALDKKIRPRTPRHNGKVERSHRNDQERFYNHMSFYSYDDLKLQMERYLRQSNNIPMQTLGWKSPLEKRKELEQM